MTSNERDLESMHATATRIFLNSLDACRIESAFDRHIQFEDGVLRRPLAAGDGEAPPRDLRLKDYRQIFVVAIGKAAVPMLDTLLLRMERRGGVRGICCSPAIPEKRNWRIRYFAGGHPLPNEDSFAAARATLALLRKANTDTLVIFLISGGGSALFDLPLDPAITVNDAIVFHQALIGCGAPITEVNSIRKYFSAVKGGRLALAAPAATKLSVLLPDVPLRSLDTLASGPTSPNSTTLAEVQELIARYALADKFPPTVRSFFERGALADSNPTKGKSSPFLPLMPWGERGHATETVNSKQEETAFRNSVFEVLLSSHDLVENARIAAERAGYFAVVDNSCDDWDYADAARYLLQRFAAEQAAHPRCCLISGGEVTVVLNRTPGAGGRNQQFVLACALELAKTPEEMLVVFSAGSDGIDGNTRAAGAMADPTTVQRALAFGYDPEDALARFDACPLLTALGDSVVTGPTGHNLRDLRLFIAEPH